MPYVAPSKELGLLSKKTLYKEVKPKTKEEFLEKIITYYYFAAILAFDYMTLVAGLFSIPCSLHRYDAHD
ncbi:hypothetical protein MIDIC_290010 [Alphaproteobacteria bacterium]